MDLPQQGVGQLAGSGFTVKALTDSSRLLQVLAHFPGLMGLVNANFTLSG